MFRPKPLCLISKILMNLIIGSPHVNLLELQQREGEHIEQQGTTEMVKKWAVIHKQGLQATAICIDLTELKSFYEQIKLHWSCSLLELSGVECR